MEAPNRRMLRLLILLLTLGVFSLTLIFHGQLKDVQFLPAVNQIPLTRKLKDPNEHSNQLVVFISTTFQWLEDIMLDILGAEGEEIITIDTPYNGIELDPNRRLISPNLSTCHKYSRGAKDLQVKCCPPKPESEEPFIDFKLPDPSSNIRVRRPAHLLDKKFLKKYTKALKIMKSLPFEDPRSFKRQADMHCIYCTGAYNQKYSNFPLNIHASWLFFPWHRMMIYFHERILANLIQDETFALPFWNWDSPQGMVIPDYYMKEPFLDENRDRSHLPPQVADINYNVGEEEVDVDTQISRNLAFMYNQMVSGAKKTELFMGCPLKIGEDGSCSGRGTIENAPHNTLHTWIGSDKNQHRENMGVFYSAARDPIFYAHHSNIDRLWDVWRELTEFKLEITDPDWLDSYFFFHDENAQLVRIKIRDVLNITNLGYTYQKVDLPWLNARPKPSMPSKFARSKLNERENDVQEGSLHGNTLDKKITVKVWRPKKLRSKREKEEAEEVLVVYGVDVKKDMYVKFDVFVNVLVDDGGAFDIGPESREFAGSFVNMRRGVELVMEAGDAATKRKTDLKLGISELLEDLEADGDEAIFVTLVPRGGTGVNTTVDGIRIQYMV